ncbi:nitroreductase family protein, partial [Chloroflexota bacterium]
GAISGIALSAPEPAEVHFLQQYKQPGAWDKGIDKITRGAPQLVIAHMEKDSIRTSDCYIALTYLELAAYSMGIGACWAGYIYAAAANSESFTRALELPEGNAMFGGMMIGYPKYKFPRIPARNDARVIWRQ